MANSTNRYSAIIAAIFAKYHQPGLTAFDFRREDIVTAANELGVSLPKNIGDVLYSFRYRADLPTSVTEQAPAGYEWVIRPIGKAQYRFALVEKARIAPSKMLAEIKILDATPGIITRYAISDEQGLLARLRYNRLIDIFTGVTCYSLQNHLRTSVNGIGQVETDELYIGVDRRGAHYVFPVQAKGGSDKLSVVQIEQDFAMCAQKFPGLICKPIAAQFADPSLIVLFAFEQTTDGLRVVAERHYRLVDVEELSNEEIAVYQTRPE